MKSIDRRLSAAISEYVQENIRSIHAAVLLRAIRAGDIEMVQHLLTKVFEHKADLVGNDLLLAAAESGSLEMTNLLLEQADIFYSPDGLARAIATACNHGHTEVVRELARLADEKAFVDSGNLRSSLLINAASRGNLEMVHVLLEGRPNVNEVETLEFPSGYFKSYTALTEAVENGHFAVARLLLENGADPNLESPLFEAVRMNNKALVQLLVEYGATIETPDAWAHDENVVHSALIYACLHGCADAVEVLAQKGANLNAKDHRGLSALTYATLFGHQEISMALVRYGADCAETEMLLQDVNKRANLIHEFQAECFSHLQDDWGSHRLYYGTLVCADCEEKSWCDGDVPGSPFKSSRSSE